MICVPKSLALVATAVIGGMCGAGLLLLRSELPSQQTYAAEAQQALAARQDLAHITDLSAAFRQVAKSIRPSVVSISSVTHVRARSQRNGRPEIPDELRGFFGDDAFDRFFDFRDPRGGFDQQGLGTGVIVSSDGYVVTNNHVIRGADEVTVTLSDDRALKAKVVGADPKTDLAVLKVEAKDLVVAAFGDSDSTEVGEWVLAIGSPFGLDQTVTAGIISAKGRKMKIAEYEDFLQTDAAINPGNSGGPLVNLQGQVIGINTAIASRTGGYMGVGFAIPSNMVRTVKDGILKYGRVQRGRLGAMIQDLTEDLAKSFGLESPKGVLIGDVVKGSPAEKAGLRSEDIVLKFNGQPVNNANQLRNAVAATTPNTPAEVLIFRDGKQTELTITVGELEDETVAATGGNMPSETTSPLGLAVQSLTPELARQLGYDRDIQGVVVTAVEPGSVAARAELRPKDVVVNVGGTAIRSIRDFREMLEKSDLSRGVRLQIRREGVRLFVFLKNN